ncbi:MULTISPECIES: GNAT family N-acetyltransferase [Paenibacillus]|uniref:RimJ/RimL family protein N-acetyltransferase n=1 Tax=Paenibacillus pabuli TaxID=1472 RepID=A0A855Y335_9BACL|nr:MULTISPECIES: GNAT family protein [Paenibacillus]PWW37119.1 RimJ/RimL family protein N-acetyltransferase [Paenibacillus pabuli]PXW05262.1 RimJ/RimL family protein N-acetyltransferase [Paenibacillus taichungensis]
MSQPTRSQRIPRLLETKRIYLRPFESTDVDTYFPGLFDAEMRRLTGTQNSFTRPQVERYIENAAQDDSRLMLLIALQENDQVIGEIALMDMHTKNRSAHIRIAIDQIDHQGKGYGSEALLLMLDYGFGICNLHRIELEVYAFNQRAIRTYEKLGFQREGVRRDALYYNHQYHDAIQMSMLENEFLERHVSSLG